AIAKFKKEQSLEVPNPKFQIPGKSQLSKVKIRACDHALFEIIEEKISVSSRAPATSLSRADAVVCDKPASTRRKNNRLSFASLRQIFTRMRKSFLLSASSASIQFAATEPDARTNCRTSSALPTVFGNCFTNARIDCTN